MMEELSIKIHTCTGLGDMVKTRLTSGCTLVLYSSSEQCSTSEMRAGRTNTIISVLSNCSRIIGNTERYRIFYKYNTDKADNQVIIRTAWTGKRYLMPMNEPKWIWQLHNLFM